MKGIITILKFCIESIYCCENGTTSYEYISFVFVISYLPIQLSIHKVNIFWRWIQYFIVQCIVTELSCGLPLKQQDIRIMKIKANKNYFSPDTKISLGTSDFSLIFHWKQIFFLPPPIQLHISWKKVAK